MCLFTTNGGCFLPLLKWLWGFVVWTLKRLTEGTVLQNWRSYLVNVIKPSIISEHFREYRSLILTVGKNNDMVYLWTSFTMLPLHRNNGMEPKRRLAYATEIAAFYQMQIVAKKILSRGAKREGRSGFRKQDIFFFFGLTDFHSLFNILHWGFHCHQSALPLSWLWSL